MAKEAGVLIERRAMHCFFILKSARLRRRERVRIGAPRQHPYPARLLLAPVGGGRKIKWCWRSGLLGAHRRWCRAPFRCRPCQALGAAPMRGSESDPRSAEIPRPTHGRSSAALATEPSRTLHGPIVSHDQPSMPCGRCPTRSFELAGRDAGRNVDPFEGGPTRRDAGRPSRRVAATGGSARAADSLPRPARTRGRA